jgi:lysophospholipase L1-like esterase
LCRPTPRVGGQEHTTFKGPRVAWFFFGCGGADFNECTVDGVHPTDLGFIRMAEQLAPVLKKYIR